MSSKTLSSRIFVAVTAMSAVLLVSIAFFGEQRLRSFHQHEVQLRLRTTADFLFDDAAALLHSQSGSGSFQSKLEIARSQDLRLTIIRLSGEVVAESDVPLPLPNHAGRPELIQALREGYGSSIRRSATTSTETYYLARRIDVQGTPMGFLRVAARLDSMRADLASLHRALLLSGLVALVLSLVFSAVVARWLGRPLTEIERTAAAIAAGDLSRRARPSGAEETRRLARSLNDLADQIRSRIDTMDRSRQETDAIHASMNEGVVAVDAEERVLLMNSAAARLLGVPKPLAPGTRLWEEVAFPELEQVLRAALANGEGWDGDAHPPTKTRRILSISIAPVKPKIGAVAILTDVTAIRHLEQVRIDFVANVSHEMRTPLAAVLGALETLEFPDTTEAERERFLDIAQRNAVRMQAIVADLLELSRIEGEGERMRMEEVDLEALVKNASSALSGTAEDKQITLSIDEPYGSLIVWGNEKRLEQVFTNLIENAIKYTPQGGCVQLRCCQDERGCTVQVTDTGVGIPAAAVPRIFERFYRVDKSRSREMGGTGLGLAIVKHSVRAHGGRVEVESQEGAGSTFRVFLPTR